MSCQDVALLVKNIKIKIGLLDVEIRLMKLYLIKTFFFFNKGRLKSPLGNKRGHIKMNMRKHYEHLHAIN